MKKKQPNTTQNTTQFDNLPLDVVEDINKNIVKDITKNFACKYTAYNIGFIKSENRDNRKEEYAFDTPYSYRSNSSFRIDLLCNSGDVMNIVFETSVAYFEEKRKEVKIVITYNPMSNGILEVNVKIENSKNENGMEYNQKISEISKEKLSFCLRVALLSFYSSIIEFKPHSYLNYPYKMYERDTYEFYDVIDKRDPKYPKLFNSLANKTKNMYKVLTPFYENKQKIKSENNVVYEMAKKELGKVRNILQGKEKLLIMKHYTRPYKVFDVSQNASTKDEVKQALLKQWKNEDKVESVMKKIDKCL